MTSIHKFTGKAEGYMKYRPRYPDEYIDYLVSSSSLNQNSIIADIGSGTGILSRQLLDKGLTVLAVEPNEDMRNIAEHQLCSYAAFLSVNGTAENATLKSDSIDLITVAQAFHWFDRDMFKVECQRILKKNAKVALVWNCRDYSNKVVQENEAICKEFCPDYVAFSSGIESKPDIFEKFFMNGSFEIKAFKNDVQYDLNGFIGRNLSGSYAPAENDINYDIFISKLTRLYEKYSRNGMISLPSVARSYLGFV